MKSYSKGARECVDESLRKLQLHNDVDDEDEKEETSHSLTLRDFRKICLGFVRKLRHVQREESEFLRIRI